MRVRERVASKHSAIEHPASEHPADEVLSAYADDELESGVAAEVAAHLQSCLACRRRLEEWRGLGTAARAAAALKTWPEEVFRRELLARLSGASGSDAAGAPGGDLGGVPKGEAVGRRLRRLQLRPKTAAVAAALVLLLAGAGLGWARSSYDRHLDEETGYLVREHQTVRLGIVGSAQFAGFSEAGGAP